MRMLFGERSTITFAISIISLVPGILSIDGNNQRQTSQLENPVLQGNSRQARANIDTLTTEEHLKAFLRPAVRGRVTEGSLPALLEKINEGDTVALRHDVYIWPADRIMSLKPHATLMTMPGTRSIILGSDGHAPRVFLGTNSHLIGVWLGGGRKSDSPHEFVHCGNDVEIAKCTFFNYFECINEGGHSGTIIRGNRFVNCGSGTYYHPIYINNDSTNHNTEVSGNIFVACSGYAVHGWHNPTNMQVINNFVGECENGIVLQGTGHVAKLNVIWSTRSTGWYFPYGPGECIVENNLIRSSWTGVIFGLTAKRNFFMGDARSFGDEPTSWSNDDFTTLMRVKPLNIDRAIGELKISFANDADRILSDPLIEKDFSTIENFLKNWASHTNR